VILLSFVANGKEYSGTFGDSYIEAALEIYNRGEKPILDKTTSTETGKSIQNEFDKLEYANGKRCF